MPVSSERQGTTKVHYAGTHRVRAPEETWSLIGHRVIDFGITRLADVTGLDFLGIPVFMAVRPAAKTLSTSQGKGRTPLLAKISAAMEAIELWHAESACPAPTLVSANAKEAGITYALSALDSELGSLLTDLTPLDWVLGTGAVSGAAHLVPIDSVRLAPDSVDQWRPTGIRMGSNGLASGNSHDEASLHALYELIERDALSQSVFQSFIDTASVDDEDCQELLESITRSGAYVEIFEVLNRCRVPCFGARVWSEDFPVMAFGSGAHSDPAIALSRALTESVQSRLTTIAGSRDDILPIYPRVRWGIVDQPSPAETLITWNDASCAYRHRFDDVHLELGWLASKVHQVTGNEPILIDLSSCNDFAVVKAVAPGLRFMGG